jgi:hypothetical protein
MKMEAIDDAIDRTRSSGVVDVPSREPSARASRRRTLPASFVPSEDTSVSVRAARIGSPAISRLPQARPALHTLRVFILGSARDRPERLTRSRRRKVLERRGEIKKRNEKKTRRRSRRPCGGARAPTDASRPSSRAKPELHPRVDVRIARWKKKSFFGLVMRTGSAYSQTASSVVVIATRSTRECRETGERRGRRSASGPSVRSSPATGKK